MLDQWIIVGLSVAAIATGLVAGVFMTFSDVVMRSLAAAQPSAGIEVMQIINQKVYKSVFLVLLLGMVPVSLAIAAYAFGLVPGPASIWLMLGSLLYMIGVLSVTLLFNVPMNQRLDRMDHGDGQATAYWSTYVKAWTWWNHVRSTASFGSAACYIVGVILLSQASS